MIDAKWIKILIPLLSNLLANQIAFIDDKHKPAFSHLSRIVEQIITIKEERISTVDNLNQDVYPFHHSPKLSPDLYVFLVRSYLEVFRSLFNFSELAPPI